MNTPIASRLGAACGAVFAIVLFVAAGNGSQAYFAPRAVAGLAALALFIPFAAYLCSLLRESSGWLSQTALASGVVGITLKIVSTFPELALHRAHVADGTPLHRFGNALAGGATVIALYPLALFCATIALVAFRSAVLPRWLAAFAAITAAALAVNGAFLGASFVPALVLFILWTLVASIYLVKRAAVRVPRMEPLAER